MTNEEKEIIKAHREVFAFDGEDVFINLYVKEPIIEVEDGG